MLKTFRQYCFRVGPVRMFFLWLPSVILLPICALSGVRDQQCVDNCSCCIEQECRLGLHGWTNVCTVGCIDGHRGGRCYELCQYEKCKSCGFLDDDKTCTACYDGYYLGPNKDCTLQCPSNCKSCTSSTMCTKCKDGFYDKDGSTTCKYAYCPANCECNGQGDCISCKKGYHGMSTSCTKQCPVNCLTCVSDESCNECKNGFYNGYEYDNNINVQLDNCTYACRHTCTQCRSYNVCLQCVNGKYGNTCQEDCSVGCKDKTCSPESGHCECTVDFTGDKCMKCVDGKYGLFCNDTCSKYCKGNVCERTSGYCLDGCFNQNMYGGTCYTCIAGKFSELCDEICPENCKDIRCERYSGNCSDGCAEDFDGTKCDACVHGKYGTKCELNCPVNCAGNVCKRHSGACFECLENFQGKQCNECKLGYYGKTCHVPCSLHCANYSCNRDTGNCVYGCSNGYSGDKCCVLSESCIECHSYTECKKCVPGFYKNSCNETCPGCCNGSCHISTGECIQANQQHEKSNTGLVATAALFGSMFILSIAVNIVLLALFLLKKIKVSGSNTEREPIYQNQLKDIVEQYPSTIQDGMQEATDILHSETVGRNIYEGISSVNEKEHEYLQVSYDHSKML